MLKSYITIEKWYHENFTIVCYGEYSRQIQISDVWWMFWNSLQVSIGKIGSANYINRCVVQTYARYLFGTSNSVIDSQTNWFQFLQTNDTLALSLSSRNSKTNFQDCSSTGRTSITEKYNFG